MKYRPVSFYLDKAIEKMGVKNDSRLALENKMQPSKVHNWRHEINVPNQEISREIARWGAQDETRIMIEQQIWEAEKRGDKEGISKWVEVLKVATRDMANSLTFAVASTLFFIFNPISRGI